MSNTTQPQPDTTNEIDDFLESITAPRETITAQEMPNQKTDDAPITDNDEQNLSLLDYDPEHRETALFFIGLIDSAMGMTGMFISGMPAEKYQRFSKSTPPSYYVDVTAALVKKYQARMNLESMFITALLMTYGAVIPTAMADRAKRQELEEKKAMEEEISRRAQMINNAKSQKNDN